MARGQATLHLEAMKRSQGQQSRQLWVTCAPVLVLGQAFLWAAPLLAQDIESEENAVTQAEDAFGQSVGNERVGLYSGSDIRGFSPVDAGNGRISGLYFAQVAAPPNRIATSSMVRVGLSAQGYPFPAPTGIVDYSIEEASAGNAISFRLERGQYGSAVRQVEANVQLGAVAGAYVSLSRRQQFRHEGGDFQGMGVGGSLTRILPDDGRITAFAYYTRTWEDEAAPVIFPAGDTLPPEIERRANISQPWAQRDNRNHILGAIAQVPIGQWSFGLGLFHTGRDQPETYADLFTRLNPDGTTPSRVIVADGNNRDRVTSGELRISRQFGSAQLAHMLIASLRGKDAGRDFGGTQRIDLGPSTLLQADVRARPQITLGPENRDEVQQGSVGLAYSLVAPGRFSLDASVSLSRYRKRVDFAAAGRDDVVVEEDPVTASLTGSLQLTDTLVLYGGHVRGFEDAVIAPEVAANRGDAPPAIRTRQTDIGLRFALPGNLRLVAGLFTISKPYINLDNAQVFRQLGDSTNRGLELSLSGSPLAGLNIIAGAVFTDARISGELVDQGVIGSRPVSSAERRIILDVDWRPDGGRSPFSFDVSVNSLSAQVGNAANTLFAPGREVIDVGMRYRLTAGDTSALLRVQVNNLTNVYSWTVSSSGGFQYERSRNLVITFQVDF